MNINSAVNLSKQNAKKNNDKSIEAAVGRALKLMAEEVNRLKIPNGPLYLSRHELDKEIKAKIRTEVKHDVGLNLDRLEDIEQENQTVKIENISLKKLREVRLQETRSQKPPNETLTRTLGTQTRRV
jgi:hypothetical protein